MTVADHATGAEHPTGHPVQAALLVPVRFGAVDWVRATQRLNAGCEHQPVGLIEPHPGLPEGDDKTR